jgi:hypothetical protein
VPKTKVLEQYPHPKYPRLIIDRRTNSRFYQARTFLDGKLKQKSTKSDHLPTAFKLGEDWYKREVRSSASFGLQHPIAKLTTDPTIAELFSTYCAELETRKQPYAKQKWSPIAPFWRALLLSTVTSDTFKTFYTWRRREKVKAHTLHKDVVLIRQILKYAIDQNMLDVLPRIPSVGTIAKNPRPWFTPQELVHLLKLAEDRVMKAPNVTVRQQRQDLWDTLTFLRASMLRVGELRTLRFHSCRVEKNPDGDKMLLCEVTGKRGTRTVVAQAPAAWVFEERAKSADDPSDLIFPSHCRDAFRELLIAAELRTDAQGFERNLKSMRATAISLMLLENPDINLTMVARNAGTSIQMIDDFYAKRLTAEMHKDKLSAVPFSLSVKNPKSGYLMARLKVALRTKPKPKAK